MPMLKKVGLPVLVFVILAAMIGLLLPSTWRVERSVTVGAPPEVVFAVVNTPKTWPEWTAWSRDLDPEASWSFEGPASGVGALMKWRGPMAGVGELEITESEAQKRIAFVITMAEDAFKARGTFLFEPASGGTRVTWVDEGDLGMNPFVRYFGLRMDSAMGQELDKRLANLKRYAEEAKPPSPLPAPSPAPSPSPSPAP
jgi:uncharacterized protein YndB with AHSA1/START domain